MGEGVGVARDGAVATVVVSNPGKRNALNPGIVEGLRSAFDSFATSDDGLRCVVLRGAGDDFCAGYDIAALPDGADDAAQVLLPENPFDAMIRAVESCPVPTVARIDGSAFGGGVELAVACDIRIASDRAVFGVTPARLGIIYRPAGLLRFVNAVGLSATKRLFFTAEALRAPEALAIGLATKVVSPDVLDATVEETVVRIVANAPLSVRGTKRILSMLAAYRGLPPEEEREAEALIRACMESSDLAEGKRAFLEKRPPRFTGR